MYSPANVIHSSLDVSLVPSLSKGIERANILSSESPKLQANLGHPDVQDCWGNAGMNDWISYCQNIVMALDLGTFTIFSYRADGLQYICNYYLHRHGYCPITKCFRDYFLPLRCTGLQSLRFYSTVTFVLFAIVRLQMRTLVLMLQTDLGQTVSAKCQTCTHQCQRGIIVTHLKQCSSSRPLTLSSVFFGSDLIFLS